MKKNRKSKKSTPVNAVTAMTHTAGGMMNPRAYDPAVRAGGSFKSVR